MSINKLKKVSTLTSLIFLLFTLTLTTASAAVNLTATDALPSPVGHWRFDAGSGTTAVDSSGNNSTGAFIGTPTWTGGQVNGALDFNGSNNAVDVGNPWILSVPDRGSVTMCAWINPNNLVPFSSYGIMAKRAGNSTAYGMNFNTSVFVVYTGGLSGSQTFPFRVQSGAWTHVCGIISSGPTLLYVNGTYFGGSGSGGGVTSNSANFKVGTSGDVNEFFPGKIDEVQIFDEALNSTQITAVYNNMASTPLVATVNVPINLSNTIANIGNIGTGIDFYNFFQIAVNPANYPSIIDLPPLLMPALGPGASAIATSPSVTFNSSYVPNGWFRACADKSSRADELGRICGDSNICSPVNIEDETDNCGNWTKISVISGPVPVVTISANPAFGVAGVINPIINWSATNSPTSCTASGSWSGAKAASGSQAQGVISTPGTYAYTLTCSNANGASTPVNANVTVSAPLPPVVTISANPVSGTTGVVNPALTWSATNSPTSCTASSTTGTWTGSKAASGGPLAQGVISVSGTHTYTLICTNSGGPSAPVSAQVVSSPLPVPVVTLSVSTTAPSGTSGTVGTLNPTLTWNSTNSATFCTATGDWVSLGQKPLVGTEAQGVLTLARTYTYALTCTNSGGTSAPVSVTVTANPAPVPVVTLSVSPTAPSGTSGVVNVINPKLIWSATNNPTSCTASGDWSGSKISTGFPQSQSQGVLTTVKTYTYTMTCTNVGGTSTPVSVSVVVRSAVDGTVKLTARILPTGTIVKDQQDVKLEIKANPIPSTYPTVNAVASANFGNLGSCKVSFQDGICYPLIQLKTSIIGTYTVNYSTTNWITNTGTVSGSTPVTVVAGTPTTTTTGDPYCPAPNRIKTIVNMADPTKTIKICECVDPYKYDPAKNMCISPTTYNYLAPIGGEISFDYGQSTSLSRYVNLVIKILIGLAAVLAMVMIVLGGIQYMTSELISSKEEGKRKITNAIIGLVVALGSYILLFTINPDLLKTNPQVQGTTIDYTEEELVETATGSRNVGGTTVACTSGLTTLGALKTNYGIPVKPGKESNPICSDMTPIAVGLNNRLSTNSNWYITSAVEGGHSSKCHKNGFPQTGNCFDIAIVNKGTYGGSTPNQDPYWKTVCEAINYISNINYLNEASRSVPPCNVYAAYSTTTGANIHIYKSK